MEKEIEIETPLSCPLCRNIARLYHDTEQGYFVCCSNSDKVTDFAYKTGSEAIKAWNDEIIAMRKIKGES